MNGGCTSNRGVCDEVMPPPNCSKILAFLAKVRLFELIVNGSQFDRLVIEKSGRPVRQNAALSCCILLAFILASGQS